MAEVATVEELVVDEVDCLAVVVPDPAVAVRGQYADNDSLHVENLLVLLVVVPEPVPGMH
jgi:hypothetical protein